MKSFRYYLLKASVPVQKLLQKMHPPEPRITWSQAIIFAAPLKDGDILLSREKWHFTNLFIPGYWSHAALFYWHGPMPKVIEAVGEGVIETDFFPWLLRKHSSCGLTPQIREKEMVKEPTSNERLNLITWVKTKVGKKYDYFFGETKADSWFCSELVFDAWFFNSSWASDSEGPFTTRQTFGKQTVTPDDFYNAAQKGKLKVIFEHRS